MTDEDKAAYDAAEKGKSDVGWTGSEVDETELSGRIYALKARMTTRTVKGDLDGLE